MVITPVFITVFQEDPGQFIYADGRMSEGAKGNMVVGYSFALTGKKVIHGFCRGILLGVISPKPVENVIVCHWNLRIMVLKVFREAFLNDIQDHFLGERFELKAPAVYHLFCLYFINRV